MGPVKCGFISGFRIFPTGNNTDWKPFVIWMPNKKCCCYMLFHPQDPFWVWLENTIFTYLSTQTLCVFFPSQAPFVLAYFLLSSAQRWLVEIRKPSSYLDTEQGSFTPWVHGAVWSKAATMSFSTKVTRNNHQQSKAKHKIMFNWNRVIVCTHSRISRWPPVYLSLFASPLTPLKHAGQPISPESNHPNDRPGWGALALFWGQQQFSKKRGGIHLKYSWYTKSCTSWPKNNGKLQEPQCSFWELRQRCIFGSSIWSIPDVCQRNFCISCII